MLATFSIHKLELLVDPSARATVEANVPACNVHGLCVLPALTVRRTKDNYVQRYHRGLQHYVLLSYT